MNGHLPRIALISPFPPEPTGIADYAVDLLSGLMQVANVTCFTTTDANIPVPSLPLIAYPDKRWAFDATLYQMGNNVIHKEIYEMAIQYPGYLFLHDYNLHDFIATITADSFGNFTREMAVQDEDGIETAWKIVSQLEGHPFENPLNARLIGSSLGVFVHSHFVAAKIHASHPSTPCWQIPMVAKTDPQIYPLPLPEEDVLLAVAGKVTAPKQVDFLLRAMAKLDVEHPLHLILVGTTIEDSGLGDLLTELDAHHRVTGTGYCDSIEEFDRWLASADYLVGFREPTVGETSAGILRALAVGTPSVVFDHGWYSEIPDQLTTKLAVLDMDNLVGWLARCEKPSAELRAKCKQYVQDVCAPVVVAQKILAHLHCKS